jgi:4,5-dihydroxyphthalate decarboxylase
MTELTLKIAIDRTRYTEALFDGSVTSDRVALDFITVKPITRAFRRMARSLEFDACEMALATLAVAHGYQIPVQGVPAVLLREYPLAKLVCLRDSPLHSPAELRGRRIAVRAYSQTTAVWVRGLMQTEYGVQPQDVTWLVQEDSHVAQLGPLPTEQALPPGLEIYDALASGVADAAITLQLGSHPNIRTVIPDAEQVMRQWFARHGAEPINHLLVVKTELLARHAWLRGELASLFERARRAANGNADAPDPAPYSAAGADLLLGFCSMQGLTPRAYGADILIPRV